MSRNLIEKISHGFVVQQIDPDTMECVEQDFHQIESVWEDHNGNSIEVCPELEEKPFPVVIKSQREINEVPLHTLL